MKNLSDRLFEEKSCPPLRNSRREWRLRRHGYTVLAIEKLEMRTLLAGDLEALAVVDAELMIESVTTQAVSAAPLNELPVDLNGPVVDFILTVTSPDGLPLASIELGTDFVVHVYSEDLRTDPEGVFAGFLDVVWDSSLAIATGPILYTAAYANVLSGDASTPGLVDEAGAVSSSPTPIGGGLFELFSIPMRAVAEGDLVLSADAADEAIVHDVLLYGWNFPVPRELVRYGSSSISIEEAAGDTETGPAVDISLQITAPDGSPLTALAAGDHFVLHVSVQDLRSTPNGVFAGFLDIGWDGNLAVVTGPITYGAAYENMRIGDTSSAGLIDEAGAVAGLDELAAGTYELFSIPMQAVAAGNLAFVADAAEVLPAHDVLLYGRDTPVPDSSVQYGNTVIAISGGEAAESSSLLSLLNEPVAGLGAIVPASSSSPAQASSGSDHQAQAASVEAGAAAGAAGATGAASGQSPDSDEDASETANANQGSIDPTVGTLLPGIISGTG